MSSALDNFLDEVGVRAEFEVRAVKEVIAWQIQQAMTERSISKARMAAQMGTSRAQLDRLLDPGRDVTLSTLARAARVVGRTLRVELQ
ncbi:helix-turn-helix domain-containing protein [Sphaerotilus microaerophilus]|uniref:helix-turn-helix domain-containing protein n=1 Tax=Sphaerotilus microaerophilus TaxID=2914710 RepID=UPI0020730B9E|nr:helix-turn-helix transcriptional regulator [Sphaerotilus sp. FB-5]